MAEPIDSMMLGKVKAEIALGQRTPVRSTG